MIHPSFTYGGFSIAHNYREQVSYASLLDETTGRPAVPAVDLEADGWQHAEDIHRLVDDYWCERSAREEDAAVEQTA